MSDCPYTDRVDAFHDQAMGEFEADWMAQHVRACPSCAERLRQTREIGLAFSSFAPAGMPGAAKSRLHSAVQLASLRAPARFAWEMTGLAASVLVAASIWLATLPASANANSWERAAATGGRSLTVSASPLQQQTRLASWIVSDLTQEPK